ncbi:MAG TPA: hypothetical protein VE082_02705, partial [Desulfobaccales bacterium]|nr:hypothetical protein [Desulfobaccales bacterium]
MDEDIFSAHPIVIPFPWKEYLLAAFVAPIALMFLFGVIIQGFEVLCKDDLKGAAGAAPNKKGGKLRRVRYLLGLLAFMVVLVFVLEGKAAFILLTEGIKFIGLGGTYVLIALMALALLYVPLRLWLRYRLQKKAMEYQYLLTLAERHGVVVVDPRLHPQLAADLTKKKKNLSVAAATGLPAPDLPSEPDPNKPDL